MKLLEYIREDILRFYSEEEKTRGVSRWSMLGLVLSRQELWALIMYRITLPASPDAAGPSPETPAADSTRGTRIDLLAGDEQ